jgi:hypothetical protein
MHIGKTESEHPITTSSTPSPPQASSDTNPQYNTILVPHDGSEMADKALNHAIYLSKISGAEIVILHIVEHIDNVDSSALLATSKKEGNDNEKERKMRLCKEDKKPSIV